MEPFDAALELGRRFLHLFGLATSDDFAKWPGVNKRHATTVFNGLANEAISVATPTGPASLLASDRDTIETATDATVEGARLLPSGDASYLLHGAQRNALVPDAHHRSCLWTPRVWPGALLIGGAIAGTWRRSGPIVNIEAWRRLDPDERSRVEAEAAALPLPEPVSDVRWHAPSS